MRARLTKLAVGLTAIAALAFGGASLAGAAGNASPPRPPAVSHPQDGDNVQQGDQSAPDTGSAAEQPAEAPATETSSEVVGNDGPGGHADEPGNPNADYQIQGEQ